MKIVGERGQLTMTEYTRWNTPDKPQFIITHLRHRMPIPFQNTYFRYFRIFVSYGPFSGKRFRPEKENRVCLNMMCATSV